MATAAAAAGGDDDYDDDVVNPFLFDPANATSKLLTVGRARNGASDPRLFVLNADSGSLLGSALMQTRPSAGAGDSPPQKTRKLPLSGIAQYGPTPLLLLGSNRKKNKVPPVVPFDTSTNQNVPVRFQIADGVLPDPSQPNFRGVRDIIVDFERDMFYTADQSCAVKIFSIEGSATTSSSSSSLMEVAVLQSLTYQGEQADAPAFRVRRFSGAVDSQHVFCCASRYRDRSKMVGLIGWDVNRVEAIGLGKHEASTQGLACLDDLHLVASGSFDSTVKFWDVRKMGTAWQPDVIVSDVPRASSIVVPGCDNDEDDHHLQGLVLVGCESLIKVFDQRKLSQVLVDIDLSSPTAAGRIFDIVVMGSKIFYSTGLGSVGALQLDINERKFEPGFSLQNKEVCVIQESLQLKHLLHLREARLGTGIPPVCSRLSDLLDESPSCLVQELKCFTGDSVRVFRSFLPEKENWRGLRISSGINSHILMRLLLGNAMPLLCESPRLLYDYYAFFEDVGMPRMMAAVCDLLCAIDDVDVLSDLMTQCSQREEEHEGRIAIAENPFTRACIRALRRHLGELRKRWQDTSGSEKSTKFLRTSLAWQTLVVFAPETVLERPAATLVEDAAKQRWSRMRQVQLGKEATPPPTIELRGVGYPPISILAHAIVLCRRFPSVAVMLSQSRTDVEWKTDLLVLTLDLAPSAIRALVELSYGKAIEELPLLSGDGPNEFGSMVSLLGFFTKFSVFGDDSDRQRRFLMHRLQGLTRSLLAQGVSLFRFLVRCAWWIEGVPDEFAQKLWVRYSGARHSDQYVTTEEFRTLFESQSRLTSLVHLWGRVQDDAELCKVLEERLRFFISSVVLPRAQDHFVRVCQEISESCCGLLRSSQSGAIDRLRSVLDQLVMPPSEMEEEEGEQDQSRVEPNSSVLVAMMSIELFRLFKTWLEFSMKDGLNDFCSSIEAHTMNILRARPDALPDLEICVVLHLDEVIQVRQKAEDFLIPKILSESRFAALLSDDFQTLYQLWLSRLEDKKSRESICPSLQKLLLRHTAALQGRGR